MIITFNKYQGAGNDFVIIDNRNGLVNPGNSKLINRICDRRFGIGADGLILVSGHKTGDYEMKYFNSDGKLGSMCGNGGRCSAHFAWKSGIAGTRQRFQAYDGIHEAVVNENYVNLQMADIKDYKIIDGNYFIDTGSPHYILFKKDIDNIDVNTEGRKIRWSEKFAPGGTNVNFVQVSSNGIYVRTFERGVEEETLACGTGITASAVASVLRGYFDKDTVNVKARGGTLKVGLKTGENKITDVWLYGPATFVFEGIISI